MKRYIYIGFILGIVALAMSLASCQKDDSPTIDPNAVRVSASVGDNVVGRSNPNGANEEDRVKFNNGDAISIKADDQDAIIYTLSNGEWTPPASDYLLWTSNAMTFNAFYPTSGSTSMTAFALPSDQSDLAKIATADYMTFTGQKTKGVVNLAFKRQTARVVVRISAFGTSVESESGTVSDLVINSGIGEIEGTEIAPITPFVNGSGGVGTTYTALVLPTTKKTGKSFITLKFDGSDLVVLDIPAHEAGYSYTYQLTVGRDKIEVGSVTVAEWETGKVIEGDTEKDPVVPPLDKYPTVDCFGPSEYNPNLTAYSHSIYVYDRNAGEDVPSVQNVPIALNWINDGTNKMTPAEEYAFKGDHYNWSDLFTYKSGISIVEKETNPCFLMGDDWRVPTKIELMSMYVDYDDDGVKYITSMEDGTKQLTGDNEATCYLPLSGNGNSNNINESKGYYWSSTMNTYEMMSPDKALLLLEFDGTVRITSETFHKFMSVRCVKTVPGSESNF